MHNNKGLENLWWLEFVAKTLKQNGFHLKSDKVGHPFSLVSATSTLHSFKNTYLSYLHQSNVFSAALRRAASELRSELRRSIVLHCRVHIAPVSMHTCIHLTGAKMSKYIIKRTTFAPKEQI